MGCGCNKKKKITTSHTVVKTQSLKGSKTTNEPKKVISSNPKMKSISQSEEMTSILCPICGMILKRVFKKGDGDLLQCTSTNCGYLRKV